jgi:23S rRNA (uracil1939-C5)-methyltransferase
VVFVEGALPGERAEVRITTGGPRFDLARATRLLTQSPGRRTPRCPHFGICGGCATQHADLATQVAAKQDWLVQNLARIGKVQPARLLPIVMGESGGYRHRARLSVRRVEKKGGVMVGFRERRSTYVADMRECPVLPPHLSALIGPLRELIERLSVRSRLPQVEVAVGDNAAALVFRHLLPLTEDDLGHFRKFADQHACACMAAARRPDSAHPFHPPQASSTTSCRSSGAAAFPADRLHAGQPRVNRRCGSRASKLLDPRPGERIADLFCGLGNFSLPIARRGADVIGFEGSRELVERARANAAANDLVAQFEVMDLSAPNLAPYGRFDKVLIDPPRQGAIEIVKSTDVRRIVYVSCDPATLARDAGVLVHTKNYQLVAAGIVNMFPHTAHVESITLFEKGGA